MLRTLNLKMSDQDWQTIRHDETLDIEVPTLLWLDGEQPILVSIRRESADPLTAVPGFDKVSSRSTSTGWCPIRTGRVCEAVSLVTVRLLWFRPCREPGARTRGFLLPAGQRMSLHRRPR